MNRKPQLMLDSMKPLDQTRFYAAEVIVGPNERIIPERRGNCLQAVLASILGLPLLFIPDFTDCSEGEWMVQMLKWLNVIGYSWESDISKRPAQILYLANGMANRGVRHSVVMCDGLLVHDPHPSREGLTSIDSEWWFPPLTEELVAEDLKKLEWLAK